MTGITIRQVYVGTPAPLGPPALELVSGIAKQPVAAAELALDVINLAGDDQADRRVHGGTDKAVYAYPSEHLPAWAQQLGQPEVLESATAPFGENVSTLGATESDVRIGDVWIWGTARLEVCQPRWPCQKLSVHRHTAQVGPMMRDTGRTGWYLRVLEPGVVPTAGTIDVEPHPAAVTVADAHQAMSDRALDDRDRAERVVALGDTLAAEWRNPLMERLAR